MIGIGVHIFKLGGGSRESANKYYGKKIIDCYFTGDSLVIEFEDSIKIQISDKGQSCCEYRYINCDDEPSLLKGKVLRNIDVKFANVDADNSYECHEIAFLHIQTNENSITVETHNEHNGYYGGFGLSIEEIK